MVNTASAVTSTVILPTKPGGRAWTLEEVLQSNNMSPISLTRLQEAMPKSGRLPFSGQFVFVTNYEAGRRLYLPFQNQSQYGGEELVESQVTLQLQQSSPVYIDNLACTAEKVFAAATHKMWVELGTPANVIYENPIWSARLGVHFSSALVLPENLNGVALTVTGIKVVPELKVLATPTYEEIRSPDVVILNGKTAFFDVAAVRVTTAGGVRISAPDSESGPEKSYLLAPDILTGRGSLYAHQSR
ncbi:hypothetical protein HYY73_03230 [Candidatus Woesearchaeota archaeon]|nr:hypothetical protein [Candidatus Woesearchaeota archaeon]